jgi:hypothetical protein
VWVSPLTFQAFRKASDLDAHTMKVLRKMQASERVRELVAPPRQPQVAPPRQAQ